MAELLQALRIAFRLFGVYPHLFAKLNSAFAQLLQQGQLIFPKIKIFRKKKIENSEKILKNENAG